MAAGECELDDVNVNVNDEEDEDDHQQYTVCMRGCALRVVL